MPLLPLRDERSRAKELLDCASQTLDALQVSPFYPHPIRMEKVRLYSVPELFDIPGFRQFSGFAFGHIIVVRPSLRETPESLVVHELVHVWQWQHRPFRMWLSYLRWRKPYNSNPHEAEARIAALLHRYIPSTQEIAEIPPPEELEASSSDQQPEKT